MGEKKHGLWLDLMIFGIGAVAGAIGVLIGGDAVVGVSVDGVAAAPGATHATGGETGAVGLYERMRRKSLVGDFREKKGRGSVGGGIGEEGVAKTYISKSIAVFTKALHGPWLVLKGLSLMGDWHVGNYTVAAIEEGACAFADIVVALAIRIGFQVRIIVGVRLKVSG